MTLREVDDAGRPRRDVPVGGDGIGPEALLHRALDHVPGEVAVDPIAEVEQDAAAARGQHIREQAALVVEDAVAAAAHTCG